MAVVLTLSLSASFSGFLLNVPGNQTQAGSVSAPPPNPYYIHGYVRIVTNTSSIPVVGWKVWINDTTTVGASGTTTTLAGGLYNYTPSVTGFKNNDNVDGASHERNATGTNTTVFSTKTSGDWMNITLRYPPLNPVLSSNVTSGEATLWVHFFNTGSPLGGNGSYTFSWIFGDGSSLWNQAKPYVDHNYTAAGTYCARLVVNDTAGDSWKTPCRTITANLPPSITSFTVAPDAVNLSSPVTFATSIAHGTSPYTYTYQFGQSGAGASFTTSSTTNSITHTYTSQTNQSYVANVTVKDSVGKSTNTSQQPVWVYLIDLHTSPRSTDVGQPVTISASALGGSGGLGFTYFFKFGDGTSSLVVACTTKASCSVSHTYSSPGSYTVTLFLNDSLAVNKITGLDRLVSVPVTLPIQVNSALAASITSNITYTDIGSPVSLTATGSGGTVPYLFFNITTGAGGYQNTTNANPAITSATFSPVTYGATGTYHPTATIGDNVGEVARNTTGVVVVNSTPQVTLSNQGYLGLNTNSAYVGESLTVVGQVKLNTGTPGFTLNFSYGDGSYFQSTCSTSGCSVSHVHSWLATGSYSVSVRVVDSVGGVGSTTQSLTVYPALSLPTLAANRSAGEVNLHVAFNSSVTGGVPGLTFAWQFGDGSTVTVSGLGSGVTNMQFHAYTVVRNATVNVTVNDTQGESVVVHLTVFIYPLLAASFTSSTATGNLNPPVNATFLGSARGGSSNYLFFNWTFGNAGSASGASPRSPVTTYWASGTYQVNLTVTDNASDKLTVSQTFVVSGSPATFDLVAGWNLMGSPVANESYTLWSLFHVLTAIYGANAATTSLTVQNVSGPGNVTYPGGGSYAATYPVAPGRGIWVDVASPLSAAVYGNLTAGPLYPKVSLQGGWNNVGWTLTGTTNATDLAAMIPGASAISMWNSTTQSYTTFIVGFSSPSYNFSIREGMGVLVWVPSTGSFTE